MKLAIMQPYLFPYVGYYQLIKSVDSFVIFDDVNYISKGWINRNNILLREKAHLITLELSAASIFKHINQIEIGQNRHKLIKIIYYAYSKAPYFKSSFYIIENILENEEQNLAKFLSYSLKAISAYLGIKTNFILSSDLVKANSLRGQSKIIDICNNLSAEHYINPIGGTILYSKDVFASKNIELSYIRTRNVYYKQFNNTYIPNLSIIDMLMFCSVEEIQIHLEEYDLV